MTRGEPWRLPIPKKKMLRLDKPEIAIDSMGLGGMFKSRPLRERSRGPAKVS
jgi:hypothetical protein